MVLSSIAGGLAYSIIHLNTLIEEQSAVASPGAISWGLISCAFILVIKQFRSSTLFEKIVAGLFILIAAYTITIFSISGDYIDYGHVAVIIASIIIGGIFGIVFEDREEERESTTLD